MKKINVITLGCSKNTVDSEHLMARLAAADESAGIDYHDFGVRAVAVEVHLATGGNGSRRS